MKTIFPLMILLSVIICLTSCEGTSENKIVTPPSAPAKAENAASTFPREEAEKLIQRLATQDGCKDSTADMRLSFTDADGKPQQMDFRLQRKYEGEKISSLMTVLSPKEESEKALLAFEEAGKPTDAISYLAGLKKTAHLKSDNPLNFRGSKSTVQEMLGLELGKYEIASMESGNGVPDKSFLTVHLEQKKGESLAFPKISVSFNKKSAESELTPSMFTLNDSRDQVSKRMEITEVSKTGNYQTIKVINIADAKNNQNLKLETRSIKYDSNLPASLFTEANLIKNITAATSKLVQ